MLALPSSKKAARTGVDDTFVDALPYIDDVDYTDSHRQLALQLIQAECANFPRTKNYMKNLPEPDYDKFFTPRLMEQFQRMGRKETLEGIDLDRYNVPSPASTGKATNKKAWQNAISNCKAQLGNQSLRKLNLELMDDFGPEAYLRSNKCLQDILDKEEADLYKVRSQLYEINSRRKRSQTIAGDKLTALGQSWVELVTKNAQLDIVSMALERDIHLIAKRLRVDPEIPKE